MKDKINRPQTPEQAHAQAREKMEAEIMTASWAQLREHAERGALFLVSPDFDLADVGVAVSSDDVATIKEWLAGGDLSRPTPEQIERWEANIASDAGGFRFLILQPYVLVQEEQTLHH